MKILLVADSIEIKCALELLLKVMRVDFIWCRTFEDGLKIFQQDNSGAVVMRPPSVVIPQTEIKGPAIFAQEIKKMNPEIPIIVSVSHIQFYGLEEGEIWAAFKQLNCKILKEPYGRDEFENALKEALKK